MEMIKNSPKDCCATVQKTSKVLLERLQQVLQMEARIVSQTEQVQNNDLQSLLCATLQVIYLANVFGTVYLAKVIWQSFSGKG
jgi:hypothetical protein